MFRHAGTEVDFYFIVEDNICHLIINVEPELKLIKDLLPIVLPSSPAIPNTFVGRSCFSLHNLNFTFRITFFEEGQKRLLNPGLPVYKTINFSADSPSKTRSLRIVNSKEDT